MIVSEYNINQFLTQLEISPHFVCDTETNWVANNETRYCMGIAFYFPEFNASWYLPVGHSYIIASVPNIDGLEIAVSRRIAGKRVIFHNAKFDLQVLAKWGGSFWNVFDFDDTMIMHYLIDENDRHDLKHLGNKYIEELASAQQAKLKALTKVKGLDWDMLTAPIMAPYAEQDCKLTWLLYQFLLPHLKQQELESVYEQKLKAIRVIIEMESYGILVDRDRCRDLATLAQSRMKEIRQELDFDPAKPSQLAHTLYSAPPLGLGLNPVEYSLPSKSFPLGRPVMNEAALLSHQSGSLGTAAAQILSDVLEYRSLQKANATWYEGFLGFSDSQGRMHPSFLQHGTVTGRYSCNKPNMQQLPRDMGRTPVKSILRAPEGYSLWEFDYSQIEFRLGALYSEDEDLLGEIRGGKDFHSAVAETLGIDRQLAKTVNFLILYGGGIGKLSATTGFEYSKAKRILDAFHLQYPGFRRVMEFAKETMLIRKYVRYWNGRKRHLGEVYEAKNAFNALVQGGAAEIMENTLIKVHAAINTPQMVHYGIKIVSQVHDSLWFEVPNTKEGNMQLDFIQDIMEWPSEYFSLSFPVDRKVIYHG